jgi:hypothetical protein
MESLYLLNPFCDVAVAHYIAQSSVIYSTTAAPQKTAWDQTKRIFVRKKVKQ